MKNFYGIMLIISMLCVTGDCDNFTVFLIWHAFWLAVCLFCAYKLEGEEA